MSRFYAILLICALLIGCAALTTGQKYVLVDEKVKEKFIPSGRVYSISEPKDIRKIIILGEGIVQNIDIYVRDAKFNWKVVKKIKRTVTFPIEISVVAKTDAVRILQKTVRGRGRINTVEFYTLETTSDSTASDKQ
jgi:hypothetical protein